MYKISIDAGKDNTMSFVQGDIVKAQKFTGNDIRLSVLLWRGRGLWGSDLRLKSPGRTPGFSGL